MYRATLLQEHWRVDDFPHDSHDIVLKLAVLSGRRRGGRWDAGRWKLALATASDSRGSTRVPHGLIANESLKIPEFDYDSRAGLQFDFAPLRHGPGAPPPPSPASCGSFGLEDDASQRRHLKHLDHQQQHQTEERCLQVKLHVRRESYYYDRDIVPLLAMLNFVAISITSLGADEFFQRGLLTLNIAFVEISIRMATDKHLPSVAYPIKLRRVLNEYFFGLLFLVLESNLVYQISKRYGRYDISTGSIDAAAAFSVFVHNAWTLYRYYADRGPPLAKAAAVAGDGASGISSPGGKMHCVQ